MVTEVNGKWGAGTQVRVPGALNLAPEILTMSCASRASCSAAGQDEDHTGLDTFVLSRSGGVWRKASAVPGLAALNQGGWAQVNAVSCTAPGDCSAGGFYSASRHGPIRHERPFVVTQTDGTWGKAIEVPGF